MRHKKGFLIAGALFLIACMLMNTMSSCSMMAQSCLLYTSLNTEFHVTKVVMLQGVSVVDIEIPVRNATENHVHSGEVVGLSLIHI